MDYVLFGMGYGASLMLLGWAFRTFGPSLKYTEPPAVEDSEFLVRQRFWVRFVQGLGGIIAIAGTTMVFMTFVVVLVNPDDDTGVTMTLAIWGFIAVSILVWCGLYLSRFGLTGIWSRTDGYGFRTRVAAPESDRLSRRKNPLAKVQPKKRILASASSHSGAVVVDDQTLQDDAIGRNEDDSDDLLPEDSDLVAHMNADVGNEVVESRRGPAYDFGDSADTTVPADDGGRTEALHRLRQRQARADQSTT